MSISVAMISRIAKNFQDYFLNVVIQKFGASVFTDGLRHAMKLPYQEFEDQRSGETLSILTKVRIDVEKFMNYFINVLFGIIVGVVFVFVYASIYIHWSIPIAYLVGILVLTFITNVLSKKIKVIQKNIVGKTTALAVAAAAAVAGYVAWTERVAAGTLALGAALVTTMTMALLSVVPTAIAMCGPDSAAFCVGHYWRQLSAMSLAVPNLLAVPRTLVAAGLAVTIVMTVRHIVQIFRRST
jgi:hypothetical protein